jgi:hypothetical protein
LAHKTSNLGFTFRFKFKSDLNMVRAGVSVSSAHIISTIAKKGAAALTGIANTCCNLSFTSPTFSDSSVYYPVKQGNNSYQKSSHSLSPTPTLFSGVDGNMNILLNNYKKKGGIDKVTLKWELLEFF